MKIIEINKLDKIYPKELKCIKKSPEKLYCIGNLKLLEKRKVAVVGSRKFNLYGKWASETLGEKLSENDIVVVSGMAKGIDTFAHNGALKNGGNTIAVLGTGVDICYPKENAELKRSIEKYGLVISEFEIGKKATKWSFPMRNRIISGLSEAVIVCQAGLNSGAIITAELAEEQGKDVYAIPGNINSPYCIGSNRLITEGVIPLMNLDDIFDFLHIENRVSTENILNDLGEDEKSVVKVILKNGEITIDKLSRMVNLTIPEVSNIVTVLEIKGVLQTSLGKVFVAK